jgi:RHS repeat-associated protein
VKERTTSFTQKYRFGFNNQEHEIELGDYYSFEYRVHDARLGRFLSVDPLAHKYPFYSPYQFCSNSPIMSIELEGLETSNIVNTTERWAEGTDGNENNIPKLDVLTIRPKPTKMQSFWKGFKSTLKVAAIVVVASAVIMATGGAAAAALAAAAPYLVGLGMVATANEGIAVVTGRSSFGLGTELTENERWERAGSFIAGGITMGAATAATKATKGVKSLTKSKVNLNIDTEINPGSRVIGQGETAQVTPELKLNTTPITGKAPPGDALKTEMNSAATELFPNSGPIMRSLSAASKAEILAKKFKMNINSPLTRQVLNSLDESVESFISTYRRSSIRSEIPGEFLNKSVEEALKSGNTTIRKLLIDGRFTK